MLSFAEAYDPLWEARVYKDGEKIETVKSIPLYSVINGFWINETGDIEIIIRYKPQDWFEIGLMISATTFIGCIAYIYDWRREKGDGWALKIQSKVKNIFKKIYNNKIIACLLRDGKVRRILFYTVQYAFDEIEEHKSELFTKVSKSAFDLILFKAKLKLRSIRFSAEDEKYIQMAKKIANEFDLDDFPFIALASKLNAPIWTNDKKLIIHGLKSEEYLAVGTKAVEMIIRGKSVEKIKQELNERYLKKKG